MSGVFEIRSLAELRVVGSPARRAIFEALLDGPLTALQIGELCGLSPESAHYHLRRLEGIGLVREVGERETGARPVKVFGLTHDRLELRRGRRSAAYVRELVRGVRRLLREAEREYERGAAPEAGGARARVSRMVGWLGPAELRELDRLEREMAALVRGGRPGGGRERVAVTMVVGPTRGGA